MPQNKVLQTLQSVDRLVGEVARASSIYHEINQSRNRQELRRAQIEAERRFNEVEEEIQADPDFYKSIDQIYEEQNQGLGEVHPHAFDEKYEIFWTGGQEGGYWKTADTDGVVGRSQQIFEEIAEKYLTDEGSRQQFETWYMEQSENMRHNLVERGYERKAEKMVLDLQDTLNNKLMVMKHDERAIGKAYDELRTAVQQGIISEEQGDQYLEDFKTNKLFNTQREAAIDVMEENGYDAARKFALQENLNITEDGRQMLLEFVDKQYKKWDQAVRRTVDKAEGEYIDAWAQGDLYMADIVNDPRLRGGHSYANDVKMRWLKRLQAEKEAAQEGKLDPNEISDPAAENRAQELFNSEFVSMEQFKAGIRELGGASDGMPGLSKARVGKWLEKADNRDDIVNPVYQSALEEIRDHYDSMIDDEGDHQKQALLRQKRLKRIEKLQDIVSNPEYKEMIRGDAKALQQIKENIMAEKVQYRIDAISGYDSFRVDNSWMDSMNWNDVEKFTRNIQSGSLYGVEDRYEEALLRYEKGIRKVGDEVFQKDYTIHREKGGNFIFFFDSGGAKDGDTYVTPNYHGKTGYMVQFRANEQTKDIEPMIWHPDLGQWKEVPQYIQDFLDSPEDEELKKRERREEAVESLDKYNVNPMGGR